MHKTCCVGMEGTLFGLQRAMPSAALPHSTAGKTSGLRRTSPMPHSATSPSSHRAEVLRDGHRDSETRARHQASLHHSTTSSRDQSVEVVIFRQCFEQLSLYRNVLVLYSCLCRLWLLCL